MRRALCVTLLCAGLAASTAGSEPRGKPSARVLFIGNSLTYANNLPAMIEALAGQAGLRGRVICHVIAKPNYAIEDHWNDGDALRGIQEGHWTHVVLQQGPSSTPAAATLLSDYAKRFAGEARRRKAAVLLYGVWPAKARAASFDAVTASYTRAAQEAGGTLVAVGEGWRAAWRRDPSLPLYGADDFHPSPAGTYLAALMFLERLTGVSAVTLPGPEASGSAALRPVRLDAAQLQIIQEAAAAAGAR